MKKSMGSECSSNEKSLNRPSNLVCGHGDAPRLTTVRSGPNKGRKFFGCRQWPDSDCKYFRWEDEIGKVNSCSECGILQVKILELEKEIDELKQRKKKMKAKKEVLEDTVGKMKMELLAIRIEAANSNKEDRDRVVAIVVVLSCFVILVVLKVVFD